jgi:20S proteasome subunit beta 7
MLCADTLGSYGGLARFKDLRRIRPVGEYTLLGAGGEYSDYQYIMQQLDRATTHDFCVDDGSTLDPSNVHSLLTRMMYERRNKGDPLWNSLLVAGVKPGKAPFLGYVDSIATAYEGDFIATGYGGHLALPILRNEWKENMTEEEAFELLRKSMEVLFYRDCRTLNRKFNCTTSIILKNYFQKPYRLFSFLCANLLSFLGITFATVTEAGCNVREPVHLKTEWSYKLFVKPKAGGDTDGSW